MLPLPTVIPTPQPVEPIQYPKAGSLPSFEAFGTEEYFIRPSRIRNIVTCQMFALFEGTNADFDDGGSAAAATGSIAHEAVAAFHKENDINNKLEAGIAALLQAGPKFPLGDTNEAKIYFAHYAKDPRNLEATILAVEQPVRLTLPCHKSDKTGKDIVIRGTVDQVRVMDGITTVCDYKTGKRSIQEMVNEYAYQLAAYFLACRESGYPVTEAKLIRGYSYRERGAFLPSPQGVFVHMPLNEKKCFIMLEKLQIVVAQIRQGEANFGVSPYCNWCPARPYGDCIDKAGRQFGFDTA